MSKRAGSSTWTTVPLPGRLGQLVRRGEATAGRLSGVGRYWFDVGERGPGLEVSLNRYLAWEMVDVPAQRRSAVKRLQTWVPAPRPAAAWRPPRRRGHEQTRTRAANHRGGRVGFGGGGGHVGGPGGGRDPGSRARAGGEAGRGPEQHHAAELPRAGVLGPWCLCGRAGLRAAV